VSNAIPAFERQRQEDHEFKVNLVYTVRVCLEKQKLGLLEWLKW
jgi:hypothetical protein